MNNDLIDRYIYAVTRNMHPGMRQDVASELKTTIEDTLEAKGGHTKKNVRKVLTELGNPALLAEQYKGPKNYLIGPDLYYTYLRVLRLVIPIVAPIVFVISFAVGFSEGLNHLFGTFGGALSNTIIAVLHILFWVTLTFAIFEKSGVSSRQLTKDLEPWTPDSLPQMPKKYQIPFGESIGSLIIHALLAVSPFVAPYLGAQIGANRVPFFAPELWMQWTPIIVALGAAGMLLAIWKMIVRRWTALLTAANVLFVIVLSTVLLCILSMTPVVNDAFVQLIFDNTKDITLAQITQWVNWGVTISVIVTIGSYLFDAIKSVWHRLQPST